ncbi:putative transcriptional regulator YdeE [Aequitasia blattaphilus]|uniref:GyrI-like domain-containing protein n=1 Tax=Aequitasia blattaphilus TaxID=2949332 RepID=A0ABT1EBV9_9FIRM|nr:GyrI-like domain-containing protein [Aequitasia blattaphilus]MCP1103302.1 GyrI-like domain-containing protein [Aequitasia blattaphilus]MCR8615942.1 GyrI-like domain-containing protein [Aequitasia blattaphilus]
MEYEVIKLKEKIVAGVESRTNNASPDMNMVIGGLWRDFYEKGIHESIPNKSNKKALGIYTDYARDESGDYTIVVACEVEKEESNENVVFRRIPAGSYAKFVVQGDMVQAVADFWQKLWKMDLPRAYTCDFEEYQDESMDNATIHMYIALK